MPHRERFFRFYILVIPNQKCIGLTESFEHLHASILPFEEHSVVERVERPAHPYQDYLQTTWKSSEQRLMLIQT